MVKTELLKKGLLPKCGERSKSINDTRVGVCFTNDFYTLPVWYMHLYSHSEKSDLCVLSFQIDDSLCVNHVNKTEFITYKAIKPENIYLTSFLDQKTKEEIAFTHLSKDAVRWVSWCTSEKIEVEEERIPIKMLS